MIAHEQLLEAGAPELPEGLQYKIAVRRSDADPGTKFAAVRIIYTHFPFWRYFIGDRVLTEVERPLTALVDPADDSAFTRNLAELAEAARRDLDMHLAERRAHAAIRR